MLRSGFYTQEEIIKLVSERYRNSFIYESLDILIPKKPYQYLLSLFWTENQGDLGTYYERYSHFLTQEQQSEMRKKLLENKIPLHSYWNPTLNMSEEQRLIEVQTRLNEGDFEFLSQYVKPSDPLDRARILADMLSASDYLSILENSFLLQLRPDQVFEYGRAALAQQMDSKHGWWRYLSLINAGVIPDILIAEVLPKIQNTRFGLLHIADSPRLTAAYGRDRVVGNLFGSGDVQALASRMGTLRLTKWEALKLVDMMKKMNSQFQSVSIGEVWAYIDTLG